MDVSDLSVLSLISLSNHGVDVSVYLSEFLQIIYESSDVRVFVGCQPEHAVTTSLPLLTRFSTHASV